MGIYAKDCSIKKCHMLATSLVGHEALSELSNITKAAFAEFGITEVYHILSRAPCIAEFKDICVTKSFDAPIFNLSHHAPGSHHCESFTVDFSSLTEKSEFARIVFDPSVGLAEVCPTCVFDVLEQFTVFR